MLILYQPYMYITNITPTKPQGSVLGSILFNIYIYIYIYIYMCEITHSVLNTRYINYHMHANDIQLYINYLK